MVINMRNMDKNTVKQMLRRLLPSTTLLTVTYAIFTPSSLFVANIKEFLLSYIKIVPIILCIAVFLYLFLNLAALFITDSKSVTYYIAFIFAISLCAYVQRNFLNPQIHSLDGADINWSYYSGTGVISICFWAICILTILGLTFRYKEKAERIIGYIANFLSVVQIISLIVLIFTFKLPFEANHGFSKEGEFTIGSEENIVIFVVDTLQGSVLEEYITSDVYPNGQLDDFTFFDRVVSGGAQTELAIPMILTGKERDPLQPIDEYRREIWQETPFFDYLNENGYDVRIFSHLKYASYIKEGIAKNYGITVNNYIDDYSEFAGQLYKLVDFYLFPQFLKKYFLLSTDELTNAITNADNSYEIDNYKFYHDMLDAGELQVNYEKAYRLYHINGVHTPYRTDENLEPAARGSVTEQQQLQGVMKEITMYIDEMKRLGVYDSSTVIITGDHGRHEVDNPETNPAFLIKLPEESHELEYNSAPVHFRNLTATMASTVMDDYSFYGPSFYDITEESDVERLHTISMVFRNQVSVDDGWYDNLDCRLIVPYELYNLDKYQIWDPYNINRITYSMGEDIDYTTDNSYAEQINYRLYKEDNAATASNELSICFELSDYTKGDLDFHFTYSKVYNDEQNIRIYANGSRVGTVTCTSADIGSDNTITIPQDKIIDNELIIRMVFPNAVTPNQLDRSNEDTRILSVAFDSMRLE
ncbi:MAG: hypothetical protein J1E98_01295 [Lachnospiraceae bacterium]|nr:hypothetical protein [Lachnospiraceae bacterium]